MAAEDSNINQVEEQPATYNRNFQMALIAGLVLVVLVMVYASLFRSSSGGPGIEEQVQREIVRQTLSDPEQEFREQIKSQERRLQKQRVQDISEQREYIDEKTDELLQTNEQVLQDLLTSAKSPVEAWNENETIRVRQSRRAEFNFEFFAGAPDAAQVVMNGPEDRLDRFLQQEQATLAGLQQRVNLNPPLPFASTGNTSQTGSLSELPARTAETGPDSHALGTSRHFNLVGHPESDLSEPPGNEFKLLSVGSIMQAKLDQKVISDYAGPYRCRIEQNVMDVTQKFVLVPAGSLCTGQVIQTGSGHPNRIINNRMALSVRWIVRPDGTKIKFLSQALDHEGIGAIKGKTNYHFLARFGGAAAFALLSSETSRADFSSGGSGATFDSDVGQALREGGADLAAPYAGLVPTQTLNYGQKLRLFVSEDMYISPWRDVYQRLVSQR